MAEVKVKVDSGVVNTRKSKEYAQKSEAWAVGKVDGVDVPNTADQYHNNSKYYKEQADASATAAASSESDAEQDALNSEAYAVGKRNGSDVTSGDPAYHNNSKYFAIEAYNHSADADNAKIDAVNAKNAAASSKLDSEAYAVGTRNGTAVTSGDPAYHNNAKYYKDQAASYASDAHSDANYASGYANQASASATTASGHANAAAGSAGTAAAAATAASNSATAAAASASAIAATYDSAKTYAVGEYCLYNGGMYVCTTAITTAEAWTADHWSAVKVGTELTALKEDLTRDEGYIDNISQSTKNLFNPFRLFATRPKLTNENGVWIGDGGDWVDPQYPPILEINDTEVKRYTLSFEAKVEGTVTSGSGVFFKFTDATGYNQVGIPNNTSDWTEFTLTSRAYNAVQNLTTLFSSGGSNIYHIRNIQLEVGTSKSSYVYPLTAYDKIAEQRLTTLEGYGLKSYPDIAKYAYDAYSYLYDSNVFTFAGSAVRAATGAIDSGFSAYTHSDYIFVPKGAKIQYNTTISNTYVASLAVYNLDKTYTGIYVPYSSPSGEWEASADCYIIVSTLTNAVSSSFIKFEGHDSIVDLLNAKFLPKYWETYLDEKDSDINAFIANIGNHGDYFLIFTDYHLKSNTEMTARIVNHLCTRYPIDKVINCGDILNTETTKASAEAVLDDFFRQFDGVNLFNVFGNHDSNPYSSGASLTNAEVYNFLFKRNEQVLNLSTTKDGYYYIDNPLQKIRYIVLNTRENGFTDADKTGQLPWMIGAMKAVQTGWYICIIMHMGFEWYGSGTEQDPYYSGLFASGITVKTIADAYQNRGSGTVMTDVSFNFADAVGKVACVISGHAHINTYVTSDAGYSIISFDRDALNYPPIIGDATRTEGNITEQSLALVAIDTDAKEVRCLGIGAGADRTFTFD